MYDTAVYIALFLAAIAVALIQDFDVGKLTQLENYFAKALVFAQLVTSTEVVKNSVLCGSVFAAVGFYEIDVLVLFDFCGLDKHNCNTITICIREKSALLSA